jgi:hypothetical protein
MTGLFHAFDGGFPIEARSAARCTVSIESAVHNAENRKLLKKRLHVLPNEQPLQGIPLKLIRGDAGDDTLRNP